MADLFEDYRLGPGWDEMFGEPSMPRSTYEALHATLQPLSSAELGIRAEVLARAFLDQGITFALKGVERPFPLDIVPRIIAAEEWRTVEVGVAQRIRALEAFLDDVYGAGQVLADGVVPRRIVVTSAHFHREAAGINPHNGVRIHVAGVDLIRDEQGTFRVLEDNVRVPSGVSYVMENRRAMAHVLPEVFAATRIQPVESYPGQLLRALRAAAPVGVSEPTVVVLTPGVHNSAYFEHALLAREMGVELVEGRDLVCVGNEVAMRTTAGERRVDVIYRRIDDEFLDPVHFRANSVIGCAGLLNAARAGRVTIANAVGNGVADDKLLYTYVPDLIRYYLDEEPILPNVETYRLDDDPDVLAHVLDRLDELVLKPVDGSGGAGIVIGSQATDEQLAAVRSLIELDPRGWIAQREVALSMVPTLVGNRLRARHVDLRPFAVNDGENVWVLPGGLTRVALPEGALVVNSSQGGGSKDTWVLTGAASPVEAEAVEAEPVVVVPSPAQPRPRAGGRTGRRAAAATAAVRQGHHVLSRIAESLYWIGRYVERAEDTARILDVHLHRMLADPWVDEQTACRSLLGVMGVDPIEGPVSAARVVGLLGLDEHNPSSVVGALAAARENARGARETVSSEMWETLNATWHGLPDARRRVEQQGVHAFFRWVRERCSVLAGLTDATMSRDEGWLFLVLGRSVERVDMTARLLSTHVRAGGSIPSWLTLLRSCGAWETYLRTYRGSLDDRHAAEFLLLDRLFPRSVFAALSSAEACLTELEPDHGRAGVATDAQRIVGRSRTNLEFRGADELMADLGSVLAVLERTCSQVNDAVSRRYFRQTSAVLWVSGAVA